MPSLLPGPLVLLISTSMTILFTALCASLILLVSLGEGARQYLADTFSGMGSNLLQVAPGRRETKGFGSPPLSTVHKLTREDEVALSHRALALDGVSGIVNGGGTLRYGARRRDTFVIGVAERFDECHLGRGPPRPPRVSDVLRKARRCPFEPGPDVVQGYHRIRWSRRLWQRSIAVFPLGHPGLAGLVVAQS